MRPPYQEDKSSLYALGYVINKIPDALRFLSRKAGVPITQNQLELNIKLAYDNNQIIYYEYDSNGAPHKTQDFTDHCAVFAVETGYTDCTDGSMFYAQYNKTSRGWAGPYFRSEQQIYGSMQSYRIGALSFRDYSTANDFIVDLEMNLLPGETWKYAKSAGNGLRPKTQFQILESYLKIVSTLLVQECKKAGSLNYGKVKFSANNTHAAFNTGLLSNKVTDVFIVGEVYPKNWNGQGPFQISNPSILKSGRTELKRYSFSADVLNTDMVSFFENLSDIVYDATVPIDTDDLEKLHHCIDEGISRNRFPQSYKEMWEQGFEDDITGNFTQAIKRSEKIARRNYKYVVPQYRPSKDGITIQFLMPIYFSSNYAKAPDFALVLSKDEINGEKFYRLETVLELSWAYNNARAICKPDNTWLKPEDIEDVDLLDDEP